MCEICRRAVSHIALRSVECIVTRLGQARSVVVCLSHLELFRQDSSLCPFMTLESYRNLTLILQVALVDTLFFHTSISGCHSRIQ